MSKSILVIDTPENCRECKFSEYQGIVCRAMGLNKAHNNADNKPDWCPLEEIKMSNDLISRCVLLEELNSFQMSITGHSNSIITAVINEFKKSITKMIDEQPIAYNMEKMIQKMGIYKSQQSEKEMLSDNGKWLVKRVIEECIKIVKSCGATNK